MRIKSRFVLAGLVGIVAVALNSCTTTSSITNNPTTGFMWVTTEGDQMVRSFTIALSNGATTQVGNGVATGLGPVAMALTPSGTALFVANRDDNTVSVYGVNSDGSLTVPCPSSSPSCTIVTVATGQAPVALAIDPPGKLLFVANSGSDTISVFSIQGTGLTFLTSFASDPTSVTPTGPASVVVSPAGFACQVLITAQPETCYFLYAANQVTSTVSAFAYFVDSNGNFVTGSVDSSGNITPGGNVANSPFAAGTNPVGLAFSRCAGTSTVTTDCPTAAPPQYLLVANNGSNNISVFSACTQVTTACPSADGGLSPVPGSPVAAGLHPVSFIVNPARDLVFAVDNWSSQVSEYKYSSATGFLSPLSPWASTGSYPLSGGITSDGNWVFVPNNNGSTLSAYSVGASGQLNAETAITLVAQPSAVLIR